MANQNNKTEDKKESQDDFSLGNFWLPDLNSLQMEEYKMEEL